MSTQEPRPTTVYVLSAYIYLLSRCCTRITQFGTANSMLPFSVLGRIATTSPLQLAQPQNICSRGAAMHGAHTHTKKPRFVRVCVPHAGHNAKSILSLPLYCPFACARALNLTHALSLFTAQPKRQLVCMRTHAHPHVRPCT